MSTIHNQSALVWTGNDSIRTDEKPLHKPVMTYFSDAYIRHQAWMNFEKKVTVHINGDYFIDDYSVLIQIRWKIVSM